MESQSFLQRPGSRGDRGVSHSLMVCLACLGSLEILLIRKKLHSTLLRLRWSPANGRRAQDQATIPFVSFQLCSTCTCSPSTRTAPYVFLLLSVSESLPSRYLADRRHAQYTSTHMSHTWAGLWSTNAFSSLCYVMTASRRPPDRAQNASKKKP